MWFIVFEFDYDDCRHAGIVEADNLKEAEKKVVAFYGRKIMPPFATIEEVKVLV